VPINKITVILLPEHAIHITYRKHLLYLLLILHVGYARKKWPCVFWEKKPRWND